MIQQKRTRVSLCPPPPSLDIAPELQPLPTDVLQDYNKRVEEGHKGIEKKKKDENENKIDLDSLPEIFL